MEGETQPTCVRLLINQRHRPAACGPKRTAAFIMDFHTFFHIRGVPAVEAAVAWRDNRIPLARLALIAKIID